MEQDCAQRSKCRDTWSTQLPLRTLQCCFMHYIHVETLATLRQTNLLVTRHLSLLGLSVITLRPWRSTYLCRLCIQSSRFNALWDCSFFLRCSTGFCRRLWTAGRVISHTTCCSCVARTWSPSPLQSVWITPWSSGVLVSCWWFWWWWRAWSWPCTWWFLFTSRTRSSQPQLKAATQPRHQSITNGTHVYVENRQV